jgi:hypothetical protein
VSGRLPIYLAIGASLGVVLAYLLAGGASYQPLEAADPCEPRPISVLAERGVFEGIALSALDGAACELQVTREELLAAFADEESLAEFADANDLSEEQIADATRAGLLRAIDDAELEGLIPGAVAAVAREIAERVPVGTVIDLFQALPGDPSVIDLIRAVQELGIEAGDLGDFGIDGLESLRDELERLLPDSAGDLLPEDLPQNLEDLLPGGLDPEDLPPLPDELGDLLPQPPGG